MVNESLVDNHQLELFEKLKKDNLIQGFSKLSDLTPNQLDFQIDYVEKGKLKTFGEQKNKCVIQRLVEKD